MKLQADTSNAPTLSSYGAGWVGLGQEKIYSSVIIGSRGQRLAWDCTRFELLGPQHFAQLAELDVELVLFGSGQRLRFVHPAWLQALMARRIGFETMDTQAACRTYNILAGEGRSVAAALLLETGL